MKKNNQKLHIKKSTIANLNNQDLDSARAGILLTIDASLCPELCLPVTELKHAE